MMKQMVNKANILGTAMSNPGTATSIPISKGSVVAISPWPCPGGEAPLFSPAWKLVDPVPWKNEEKSLTFAAAKFV